MIYINDSNVKMAGANWHDNIEVIENAIHCLAADEYVQPVKPYLRYRDLRNRIIAMPAFLGGIINLSGIKWIASFPDNHKAGLPRAHCVVILNNADTGEPVGIINSGTISAIRTASVSGFILKKYLQKNGLKNLTIGIVGFGPIGRQHLDMCSAILQTRCSKIIIYDINGIDAGTIKPEIRDLVQIANCWQDVYEEADIFITCTVSNERYIDRQPKPGSLHLNVSLRDYKIDVFSWFKNAIIVDDWDEVCRENTDIELFHSEKLLNERDVCTIKDLLEPGWIGTIEQDQPIMFNPMGMAIFDIAIAQHYMKNVAKTNIACILD